MKREKKPREDKNKSERRRRSTGEGKRGEKKIQEGDHNSCSILSIHHKLPNTI
jgi:hypothetical protein